MMQACINKHPLTAEHLLKWGARTDTRNVFNKTALHYVCDSNAADSVKLLLAHNSPTGEPGCVAVSTLTFSYHFSCVRGLT